MYRNTGVNTNTTQTKRQPPSDKEMKKITDAILRKSWRITILFASNTDTQNRDIDDGLEIPYPLMQQIRPVTYRHTYKQTHLYVVVVHLKWIASFFVLKLLMIMNWIIFYFFSVSRRTEIPFIF